MQYTGPVNSQSKNMLCFLTNINWFQPCLKSDWSKLVNRPVRDICHLKFIGSRLVPGKSFGRIFRGLKTLPQRQLQTCDRVYCLYLYTILAYALRQSNLLCHDLLLWVTRMIYLFSWDNWYTGGSASVIVTPYINTLLMNQTFQKDFFHHSRDKKYTTSR